MDGKLLELKGRIFVNRTVRLEPPKTDHKKSCLDILEFCPGKGRNRLGTVPSNSGPTPSTVVLKNRMTSRYNHARTVASIAMSCCHVLLHKDTHPKYELITQSCKVYTVVYIRKGKLCNYSRIYDPSYKRDVRQLCGRISYIDSLDKCACRQIAVQVHGIMQYSNIQFSK